MRLIRKPRLRTAAVAVIAGMLFGIVPGTAGADFAYPPPRDNPDPYVPEIDLRDYIDLPEDDEDDEDGQHCPNHRRSPRDDEAAPGAFNALEVDGHTVWLYYNDDGTSVAFFGDEARTQPLKMESCIKAGRRHSGEVDGRENTVTWTSESGKLPPIDYTVVYGLASPGDESNRCVTDVEAQFERLAIRPGTDSRHPSGRFRVQRNKNDMLPPDPPDRMPNIKWRHGQHVQGFNRIDVGDDTWFAMTNGSNRKDAGIAMIDLGRSVPGRDGERIVPPSDPRDRFLRSDPPDDMAVRYYYPAGGPDRDPVFETDHPGGLQVVGSYVFVPYTAEGSGRVDIWDMSDPAHGRFVQTVTVPEWKDSEPDDFYEDSKSSALYVAATRTADGSYLMMVNRGNFGETTYMRSEGDRITPSMRWNLDSHVRLSFKEYEWGSGTYQNANFVTECGTGQLYLVGLRQERRTWRSDNVAELFRFEGTDDWDGVKRLNRIEPDGSDGDWCDLRGGGGIYVTPSHEMSLYCSQGRDVRGRGNHIKLSEHTVN